MLCCRQVSNKQWEEKIKSGPNSKRKGRAPEKTNPGNLIKQKSGTISSRDRYSSLPLSGYRYLWNERTRRLRMIYINGGLARFLIYSSLHSLKGHIPHVYDRVGYTAVSFISLYIRDYTGWYPETRLSSPCSRSKRYFMEKLRINCPIEFFPQVSYLFHCAHIFPSKISVFF